MAFKSGLQNLLGRVPERVPLNAEVLETTLMDGYVREKVILDCNAFSSIPAYLLIPENTDTGHPRPAVLAAHGHGNGKDDLVGITTTYAGAYKQHAVELVKSGYVVLVPDWRPFGERRDPKGSSCEGEYYGFGYLGYTLLTLNILDAQCCLDYLTTLPFVDKDRIGMWGLSFGGTMTTFASALDERIKAAVISGYAPTMADTWGMTTRNSVNTCGPQFCPGLAMIGDFSDVIGLIAPRPCMIQVGTLDLVFPLAPSLECVEQVKSIYTAAQSTDLAVDVFVGDHEVDLQPAIEFLNAYLQPGTGQEN